MARFLGFAVLFLGLIVSAGVNAMIRNEYSRWAAPVARIFTVIAGLVHPARAEEWRSDIDALQRENDPGLTIAVANIVAAPWLVIAESALRFAYWVRRLRQDRVGGVLINLGLASCVISPILYGFGIEWAFVVTATYHVGAYVTWCALADDPEEGPECFLPLYFLPVLVAWLLSLPLSQFTPLGRITFPVLVFAIYGGSAISTRLSLWRLRRISDSTAPSTVAGQMR